MNSKQLAESLTEALEEIAGMPVVDPALNLSVGSVTNAYHDALRIAREALESYRRNTPAICDLGCETCRRKICTGAKKMAEVAHA